MRAGMSSASLHHPRRLADHSADPRMLLLALMAVAVGSGGAFAAWLLLKLIAIATNLFWFRRLSASSADMAVATVVSDSISPSEMTTRASTGSAVPRPTAWMKLLSILSTSIGSLCR
jgi:hypothetical protein